MANERPVGEHTASHAVIAERLGVRIDRIEVGIDETFANAPDYVMGLNQFIMIQLAGPIAEPPDSEGHDESDRRHRDSARWWALNRYNLPADRIDALIGELTERTRDLVARSWPSILAVAEAAELAPDGVLAGDEIRRIMRENGTEM